LATAPLSVNGRFYCGKASRQIDAIFSLRGLMTTNEPHLARLSAHADTMLRGELAEQFGAICMRRGADDEVEVLLITTRRTQRWIIPKGWPIKGLKPHEVAEREAWEEAGVKGSVRESPFGYYTYLKVLDSENTMPSMVQVHLLDVKKMHDRFPEAKQRTTEWLSPSEAALRVREPELKGLISRLVDYPAL
jgi:8-oxo-dGTP pyrophosphatase MutT (NUDIX family)